MLTSKLKGTVVAKSMELADVPETVLREQEPLDEILVTARDALEVDTTGVVDTPLVVVSEDSGLLQPDDDDLASVELTLDEGEIDFSMFGFGVISVSQDAEIMIGGADSFVTFDPLGSDQYIEDFII